MNLGTRCCCRWSLSSWKRASASWRIKDVTLALFMRTLFLPTRSFIKFIRFSVICSSSHESNSGDSRYFVTWSEFSSLLERHKLLYITLESTLHSKRQSQRGFKSLSSSIEIPEMLWLLASCWQYRGWKGNKMGMVGEKGMREKERERENIVTLNMFTSFACLELHESYTSSTVTVEIITCG